MKLVFLGPPGAGKGTQAENTALVYKIPNISTGAIIRESVKNKTEAGKAAADYINGGFLVPDDVVIKIVKERISRPDCKNGFILDGFPRTTEQAAALEALGVDIDLAVSIQVSDEEIIDRMSGRRVCGECGATNHISYDPPKIAGVCDRCGGELKIRDDDIPEVVKKRLEVYHEQTKPVKGYYKTRNKLKIVVGQKEIADTTRLTMDVLTEMFGEPNAAASEDGSNNSDDGGKKENG